MTPLAFCWLFYFTCSRRCRKSFCDIRPQMLGSHSLIPLSECTAIRSFSSFCQWISVTSYRLSFSVWQHFFLPVKYFAFGSFFRGKSDLPMHKSLIVRGLLDEVIFTFALVFFFTSKDSWVFKRVYHNSAMKVWISEKKAIVVIVLFVRLSWALTGYPRFFRSCFAST